MTEGIQCHFDVDKSARVSTNLSDLESSRRAALTSNLFMNFVEVRRDDEPSGRRRSSSVIERATNVTPPPDYPGLQRAQTISQSTSPSFAYQIGRHAVPPLVQLGHVLGHLKLLGVFHKLRKDVKCSRQEELLVNLPSLNPTLTASLATPSQGHVYVPAEVTWAIYLSRAVHRFELWCTKVLRSQSGQGHDRLQPEEYPPLDVLLVWHSFLLNPRAYYEESLGNQLVQRLHFLGGIPLSEMVKLHLSRSISTDEKRFQHSVIADDFSYCPSPQAKSNWENCVDGEPFVMSMPKPSDRHKFLCPGCRCEHSTPYVSSSGMGWAQSSFEFRCSCRIVITKSTFAVRRLAAVVKERVHHEGWTATSEGKSKGIGKVPLGSCLMGTILGPDGVPDAGRAESLNRKWIRPFHEAVKADPTIFGIAAGLGWNLESAEKSLVAARAKSKDDEAKVKAVHRILAAYRQPFVSIDLTAAVNRQFKFIESMHELGWLAPRAAEEAAAFVNKAISRYHNFLNLMIDPNITNFLVPTLDIDLVWHTHQLQDILYRKHTLLLLNHIPDHDDKVEENTLATAFKETAKAWKKNFGADYYNCGCMAPQDSLWSTLRAKFKTKPQSSPSANSSSSSLLSTGASITDPATHASSHNAVRITNNFVSFGFPREQREVHLKIQTKIEEKMIEKGKAKPEAQERKFQRVLGHSPAFQGALKPSCRPFWESNTSPVLGNGYGLGLSGMFLFFIYPSNLLLCVCTKVAEVRLRKVKDSARLALALLAPSA
ncbi:hypothetical protein BT69DRAFT_1348341 [Atractiella rhizophila]|nr:hypothetical protein BT69DRAFT_1348341 [Atractiella rhizophila]